MSGSLNEATLIGHLGRDPEVRRGDYEPLPVGRALQDYWLGRLPEGERRILELLIKAYPKAVSRDDLSDKTGYARSSRDAYLQRMKAKRLWETNGAGVSASGMLFA